MYGCDFFAKGCVIMRIFFFLGTDFTDKYRVIHSRYVILNEVKNLGIIKWVLPRFFLPMVVRMTTKCSRIYNCLHPQKTVLFRVIRAL